METELTEQSESSQLIDEVIVLEHKNSTLDISQELTEEVSSTTAMMTGLVGNAKCTFKVCLKGFNHPYQRGWVGTDQMDKQLPYKH